LIVPGSLLPDLTSTELQILRKKQKRLSTSAAATLAAVRNLATPLLSALESTAIFAQHEAGTAVCIDPRGWFVTCSHCFGETQAEWRANRHRWLLSYTGLALQVECRVWDARRDLALAKVTCVESNKTTTPTSFQFVRLASSDSNFAPAHREPIICIGQPGQDDLESERPNRRTCYDLIEISEGRFCGMIPGADPQDNAEIGTLMHDAWTYWGHSGAPLLRASDGSLIGLHSSWDDQTSMRHGIPLVAIQQFLMENLPGAEV
jgi:hypothetical protein